jgi:hypothetical protein
MQFSWVFSADYKIDPTVDINQIKDMGPSWGSWKTWRNCQTDNVICNDKGKARELLIREFQKSCNFYIPKAYYAELDRPTGVNLYEGSFTHDVNQIDDIIGIHLASQTSDIVILTGFALSIPDNLENALAKHNAAHYHGLLRSVLAQNINCQYVAVDTIADIDINYKSLPNLTVDTLTNVLTFAN